MKTKINKSRFNSLKLIEKLNWNNNLFKYTTNHDPYKFPAALLYGTWSVVYLTELCCTDDSNVIDKSGTLDALKSFRRIDGIFFPKTLENAKYAKSKEYMYLHCYNYSVGACMLLDGDFDFQSSYMDYFLDSDNLGRWLDQRSLHRPWEESNNIVNVASYLALCTDHGLDKAKERLYQMLEWHNRVQNPKLGGFENLGVSRKNKLQSMAGAVHNFHLHHYLNEPMNYEEVIGNNVIPFLFEGPLTACLSIDFVELACKAIHFMPNSHELEQALIFHLNILINYQNPDGGFYENESSKRPTTANGMKENIASSNSYATWFRMCSIGMIATTLLGDNPNNWRFRNTLGMGYFVQKPYRAMDNLQLDQKVIRKYKKLNLPHKLKKEAIALGIKLLR